MGREMKYVVIQNHPSVSPDMFIFPAWKNHTDMVRGTDTVVGAGFVYLADGRLRCYGKSISLGVSARAEDADILSRMIDQDAEYREMDAAYGNTPP
jgi:hypothetical protein